MTSSINSIYFVLREATKSYAKSILKPCMAYSKANIIKNSKRIQKIPKEQKFPKECKNSKEYKEVPKA